MNHPLMPPNAEQSRGESRALALAICLGLILANLSVFLQVRTFQFVAWDDGQYVSGNPIVQGGLTASGILWAFTHLYASNWHPVTWISHMLDTQLFGHGPMGPHLTNLAFHTASAVLLFLVWFRLTGARWRSALLAGLFALHPLRVESVAWVSERKDVLSTFFFLLSLLAYARYAQKKSPLSRPSTRHYLLSLLFFALGLMSKPMIVTLPCVLLLIDFWPLQRMQFGRPADWWRSFRPLLIEKAPFFALTVGSCIVTYRAQEVGGSVGHSPLSFRCANAVLSYTQYLGKMVWPGDLAAFYAYPTSFPMSRLIPAVALMVAGTAGAIILWHRRPYWTMGWFWYLGTLMPVIGLLQVGGQAMADRDTYVPSIGIFMAVVWALGECVASHPRLQSLAVIVAVGLLSLCAVTTHHQAGYWKNSVALFEHALEVVPTSVVAHDNLGATLLQEHRLEEAKFHLASALRLKADNWVAHDNLGFLFLQQGKYQEAIANFMLSARFDPKDDGAQNLWGVALLRQGLNEEALPHFEAALRIDPFNADAHVNIGRLLATQGKTNEAKAHFEAALRIRPSYARALDGLGRAADVVSVYAKAVELSPKDAQAHYNLGHALVALEKNEQAKSEFQEAVRLDPAHDDAHYELGNLYYHNEAMDAALEQYRATIQANPRHAEAHYQLAAILMMRKAVAEAIPHYREAVRLKPDWLEAINNLAWALSTSSDPKNRNGLEAATLSAHAVELTHGEDPGALDTAAAAYAEAGRFAEAVAASQKALALADALPLKERVQMQARLDLYRAGSPYHE